MRSPLVAVAAGMLATACAAGSTGPGPAPAPAASTVMQQATKVVPPAPVVPAEPPKPKDIDPTGTYAVSLTYGGQPLTVTLQMGKRADGTYGGAISVDQVPDPIPLTTVSVSGNRVLAGLNSPDGSAVTLEFTIAGDDLSGSYRASSGDGSPISGKRIP